MMLPMFMMAQNKGSIKHTKYEEFESKTGVIVKFTDKSLKKILLPTNPSIKVKIRTVFVEGEITYFLILEKGKSLGVDSSVAYIEYSDLVEINKALARLLNEVNNDCELKPEYLQNYFTSVDYFKIGYYVEKSKATWTVRLEYGADFFTIQPKEFAEHLLNAQKEIENIIAQSGK